MNSWRFWGIILINEILGLNDRKHGSFGRDLLACIDGNCAIDP
jgi:hypothetical protein